LAVHSPKGDNFRLRIKGFRWKLQYI